LCQSGSNPISGRLKVEIFGGKSISAIIEIAVTLRVVQISIFPKIFQVSNGYMKLIGIWVLVSNRRPEKCGVGTIKRANP
jgi:hypothetical protein